jgi:ATP-dependent DNA helicase RecQ
VVYAQSRSRVERLASMLSRAGAPAVPYHAGQAQDVRRATQDRFMRGAVDIIVATSAFGMGVDKADVRLVVHDAISASLESYYQEAGRAGRDGNPSECVLLYAKGDRKSPEYFIASSSPPRDLIEKVYAEVAAGARRATPGLAPPTLHPGGVASRLKLPPEQVVGALTILERAGALTDERGERDTAWVRLTATTARINSRLGRDSLARALLRCLWRASKGGITTGVLVRLDLLPPGIAGANLPVALDELARDSMLVWARPGRGLRVTNPHSKLSAWSIDWSGLMARRRVAEGRLAAMVRYAETRGCRRQVLLGYFGDEVEGGSCGACDRCQP